MLVRIAEDGASAGALDSRRIREGDLVVVYERFDSMKPVTVTSSSKFTNRWGSFAMKVSEAWHA